MTEIKGLTRRRCPKCGTADGPMFVAPRISVTIDPYSGEYCQTCYAKWLRENIPQLEPVPAPGGSA
jgi:hypothetical protein